VIREAGRAVENMALNVDEIDGSRIEQQ